jgi:hypothetical protein
MLGGGGGGRVRQDCQKTICVLSPGVASFRKLSAGLKITFVSVPAKRERERERERQLAF